MGKLAQLLGGQESVRNGNPQHRRMTLNVKAILQTQGTEFVLRQAPVQVATGLLPVLLDTLIDNPLIYRVIKVHGPFSLACTRSSAARIVTRLYDANEFVILC